jgi:hypothetical protein
MNRFDTAAVIDLAEAVDRDGLDAHAATLFALAEQGTAMGLSSVLSDVMLSTEEPYVARVRAFVILSGAVANRRGRAVPSARHDLVAA